MTDLSGIEIEVLKEIKNGMDRYFYNHNKDVKPILDALKNLQLNGYIDSMAIHTSDGRGFTHIKLKDKARSLDL